MFKRDIHFTKEKKNYILQKIYILQIILLKYIFISIYIYICVCICVVWNRVIYIYYKHVLYLCK